MSENSIIADWKRIMTNFIDLVFDLTIPVSWAVLSANEREESSRSMADPQVFEQPPESRAEAYDR